jgi:hypothetical protein
MELSYLAIAAENAAEVAGTCPARARGRARADAVFSLRFALSDRAVRVLT